MAKFAAYFLSDKSLGYRMVRIAADRSRRYVFFYDTQNDIVAAFTRSDYESAWAAAQGCLKVFPNRIFSRAFQLGARIEDGENFYLYMSRETADAVENEYNRIVCKDEETGELIRKRKQKIKFKEVPE